MTKNIKISLFVLTLLIGIFFLNKNSQLKLETITEPIFTNRIEDIYKFLIQQGENAIELNRIDTLWTISGNDTLDINPRSIDNLFNKVLKVNKETIISEKPENYGKYSVDDSTGTHLAIIDSMGKTINYYVFGRSKSDYSRSYIRLNNDSRVYLADQNVTYMLSINPTYWGQKPTENINLPSPTSINIDTTLNN